MAVGVDGDRDARPDCRANRLDPIDVDHRVVMADLEFQAPEAVMLYGSPTFGHQVVLGDRKPTDVGVIGFELFLGGAAEQLPERQTCGLGAQIPERDVDGGERKMSDPCAADPADGGKMGELAPEPMAIKSIFADQKRRVALGDTGGDQPVGRQMRMRSGEAEADSARYRSRSWFRRPPNA